MTGVRKSTVFLSFAAAGLLLTGLMFVHAAMAHRHNLTGLATKRQMVRELALTDLSLFTDARYTRHLSQADINTPFQDYPGAFEHFPSGTIVTPPQHLRRP